MKIHLISETDFGVKANGIHSSHVELIKLLNEKNEVEVIINGTEKGDVLHSHTYGIYYLIKGLQYKKRRVHTVHTIPDTLNGSVPYFRYVKPFAEMYFRFIFNYSTVCIAISPTVLQRLKELNVKSKIVRINNPFNPNPWLFSRKKREKGRSLLNISKNEKVVLGVGQLQKRKGVEDFIEIAKCLPNIKFIWIGGRPFGALTEGKSRIEKNIIEAPKNCVFKGVFPLEEMPLVYSSADIFLFPSYQENSPIAPIEAAACNLPVIFRDIPEYESLYNFDIVRGKTNAQFTDLISKLFSDKNDFENAQFISKKLVDLFDRNHIYSQLINLYTELVNEK